MRYRKTLLIALSALAIPFGLGVSHAQSKGPNGYPDKPLRIVVPFAPGGATDIIARVISQKLTEQIGQQVIVENKAGANGNIASAYVAKAPADGYTLLYNTSSIAMSPALYKSLSYDVLTDLEPVVLTSVVPLVLAINPSMNANNLQEFIALLKANPNKYSYGNAGIGNITHMASYLLLQTQGLSATSIPYKGSGPSAVATVGGEVQFNMEPINANLPFIRTQRLRPIAVTTLDRSPVLKDIPTLSESGMPGFEIGAWQAIMVPAKTAPEVVSFLNREIMKALADPEVKEKLEVQGAQILGSTPEEYGKYLRSELRRWNEVIKSSGVTLD